MYKNNNLPPAKLGLDPVATGKRIRAIAKMKGMTVEEIAKEMGYTVQAVYKWYYGKGLPSLESAYVLSKVLDVSMESLLVPIIKKPP